MPDFIPSREPELVTWSLNLKTKITATPTAFGLTAAMATAYGTLHDAFVAAYNTANDPHTRSPVNITLKDSAKFSLIANARSLARTVQGTASVTPAQKEDLGLNPRDTVVSPIPAPAAAPILNIVSTIGNTIKVRLRNAANPTRRGKPDGVDGASVFSFVGDEPPSTEAGWKFEGNTTRTTFNVIFPSTVAPGAKVWFAAFWFNPRVQSGPACTPVGTNLPGGASMAA